MALAAVFALQDGEHVDGVGALLRFEDLVMAILAVEPLGVRPVREQYHGHARGPFH